MKEQIKDLIEHKELDITDYADAWELYDELDYDGSVYEIVDGMIDIYYYDLRKWAVDNYEYVEEAINEGRVDTSDFDFHKAIQAGQYIYYINEANESIEELYKELTEQAEKTA